MAKTKTTTTTTAYLLIISAVYLGVGAQSPAPAPAPTEVAPTPTEVVAPSPGPDCLTALADLADCLSFVDEGSNLTKPDPACCPEVADLVKSQPICLCELLSNSTQFGISIDENRALELPSLCRLKTASVSLCAAVGVPVAVSAPNPSASAPGSEENGGLSNLLPSNQRFLFGFALVLFACFF